jgi:MinD-like ATPase involved in chromosome partitioning or flagellar assembly
MRDEQLSGLRRLFQPAAAGTLAVAGEGGAPIALHLARALAADGARVLVIDRAVGAVAQCAGLATRYDLAHALDGDRPAMDVLRDGPDGVTILPAARALARAGGDDWREAVGAIASRAGAFDHWIVHGDPPAGVDTLVALAPSHEAITACYAVLKAMARTRDGRAAASIVVHGARDARAAQDVHRGVAATAKRFLGLEVPLEAFVPEAPWPAPRTLAWPGFAGTAAGRAFVELAHRRAAAGDARAAQR